MGISGLSITKNLRHSLIPMYEESNQIQVVIFNERRFNEVQNLRFNFLKYSGTRR